MKVAKNKEKCEHFPALPASFKFPMSRYEMKRGHYGNFMCMTELKSTPLSPSSACETKSIWLNGMIMR